MSIKFEDSVSDPLPLAANGYRASRGSGRLQRRKKLFSVLAICIVVCLVALVIGLLQDKGVTKHAGAVSVVRGDIVNSVNATGSVVAQTGAQVNIGSQVSGTVKRVFVDEGDHVEAGQVVALVDMPDVRAEYNQAVEALNSDRNKVEQLKITDSIDSQTEAAGLAVSQAGVAQARANQSNVHNSARFQTVLIKSAYDKALSALKNATTAAETAQANHDLQISASQSTLDSAIADATYANAQLARDKALFARDFLSESALDQAQDQASQANSAVVTARKNLAVVSNNADNTLNSAREQVRQAQADLTSAREVGFQTAAQQAQERVTDAALQSAGAQLAQAQATLQQHVSRLQDIKQAQISANVQALQVQYYLDQLAKGVIRSPIEGIVASLSVNQGETVAEGFQVQSLMTIVDLNKLQVEAHLGEMDVASVTARQPATVSFDGLEGRVFQGKVVRIQASPTPQNNATTYSTIVSLDHPSRDLRLGMTATVAIAVSKHAHVLIVPTDSIKTDGDDSVVGLYKPGSSVPVKTKVVTGAEDDTNTEIISGLNEGDQIANADWTPD